MTIEQEIVAWSATRPAWQRAVLRRLARGEQLSVEECVQLGNQLAAGKVPDGAPLTLADLPGGQPATNEPVRLLGVQKLVHVNALAPDQHLELAPTGLTVVYGDNGSGKSGYARLLKAVVHAREREEIKSDIFRDAPSARPAASFVVERDGKQAVIEWPKGDATPLAAIGFYDVGCGRKYVTTDTEISYRPGVLSIMDGLIRVCDSIRESLAEMLEQLKPKSAMLPVVSPDTPAGRLLASISASTDPAEVDAFSEQASGAENRLQALDAEIARLQATDPEKERARLMNEVGRLERVAVLTAGTARLLSDESAESLAALHARLRAAEAAAAAASQESFGAEPLPGVGTESWRILWDAARDFAARGAGLNVSFPDTSPGARCVLCQQALNDDATQRMKRFAAFVQGHAEAALKAARETHAGVQQRLAKFNANSEELRGLLDALESTQGALVADLRRFFAAAAARQASVLAADAGLSWMTPSAPAPGAPITDASEMATKLRIDAQGLDVASHSKKLEDLRAKRRELEAAKAIADHRVAIHSEIERAKERARLESARAQAATNAISSKTADLARAHATVVVRDRFTRETDRLLLERVTLRDLGGNKGAIRHKAGFVGAVQDAPLPQVLSEGEQTALGLAGFFTEAYLDPHHSALVLDDPVSSLDHRRRTRVAERLAEFAKDRQVIVFTHDPAFVADLAKAARAAEALLTERSVERLGSGQPGACRPYHPWKAKDAAQRLHQLGEELARLKRDQPNLDQQSYEARAADWGGKLSETWERIMSTEVIGQVFDLGTLEVRPNKVRVLAKFTEADDNEFQASYSRCSQWARRHDKSLSVNYVAPTIAEMDSELTVMKAWFERIKKYKN